MRTLKFAPGLLLLCLPLLPGCANTAPSSAPRLIVNTCQKVQPCRLPAVRATTNGELSAALDRAEAAWAECAAVVDGIVECQARDGGHD